VEAAEAGAGAWDLVVLGEAAGAAHGDLQRWSRLTCHRGRVERFGAEIRGFVTTSLIYYSNSVARQFVMFMAVISHLSPSVSNPSRSTLNTLDSSVIIVEYNHAIHYAVASRLSMLYYFNPGFLGDGKSLTCWKRIASVSRRVFVQLLLLFRLLALRVSIRASGRARARARAPEIRRRYSHP
jgi:hypothetical protein